MQDETLDRRAEYAAYRKTAAWRERRDAALERAGHRCQVCNSAKMLDVHHRTYERIYREDPMDLTALCRRCHQLFHGATGARRNSGPSGLPPREAMAQILGFLRANPQHATRPIALRLGLGIAETARLLRVLQSQGDVRRDRKNRWSLS